MLPMVVAVMVFRVVLSSLYLSSAFIVYFSGAILFEFDAFQVATVCSSLFDFSSNESVCVCVCLDESDRDFLFSTSNKMSLRNIMISTSVFVVGKHRQLRSKQK